MWSTDQVDLLLERPNTKGKENIMMKDCTYRLSLDELLNRPMGHLALQGRDGDDDGASGSSGGDDANKGKKDDTSDESGDDDGDRGKGKAEPTPDQKRIAGLEEEKQRFYDQREEVKRQLKEAQAEIAKLKKDGTPDDALKKSNDELTAANTKLTSANQSLMLENAFLKAKGYDWVDPEAALRLADLSQVEFDEKTNKAVGLESSLAKLAKDKPYLLKAKQDKDDEDEGKQKRSTGKQPPAGKQKQSSDARAAALRAKYPGLRR